MKDTSVVDTSHCPWFVALIIANFIIYLGVLANNGYYAFEGPLDGTSTSNASNKYYNEITPAPGFFGIWGVIYIWNLLWIAYTLSLLFRKSSRGAPAYLNPRFLPPMHYVWFIMAHVCNIAWWPFVRRDPPEIAQLFLLFMAVFQYCAFYVSYRALDQSCPELDCQGRVKDIWLTRSLVFNGMGIYATWVSFATVINLGYYIRIRSDGEINVVDSSTIALALLSLVIVTFVVLDLVFLEYYTRYTLTPYAVVVYACVGAIVGNYREGERNSIFLVVLLAVSVVLLILKVTVTIYRHRTRPLYKTNTNQTVDGRFTLKI